MNSRSPPPRIYGGQFLFLRDGSLGVWGTGATANRVCFRCPGNRNLLLREHGCRRVSTHPTCARFKLRGSRLGEVRFTARILKSNAPTLLRRGELEARGGQSDFTCDVLSCRKQGVDIPLEVNHLGLYVVSAATLGDGSSRSGSGPHFAASYSGWAFVEKRPNLPTGGFQSPPTEGGLYRPEPPQTFSACNAVTRRRASSGRLSDPKKAMMELHVTWGHASAR